MPQFSMIALMATNTTTAKTMASVHVTTGATTLRRLAIFDTTFGASTTPADTVVTYQMDRSTTAPTGATPVPANIDGDVAIVSLATPINAATIEPTVGLAGNLLNVYVNQRATYRWVCAPGAEFIVPATNLAGIGLRSTGFAAGGSYAGATNGTIMWRE